MVPCLLLCIPGETTSFNREQPAASRSWKCILQMQGHERFQFLGVMELVLVRFFTLSLHLGTFVMERSTSCHLVSEALHVVILQLDS